MARCWHDKVVLGAVGARLARRRVGAHSAPSEEVGDEREACHESYDRVKGIGSLAQHAKQEHAEDGCAAHGLSY
jgi:hypothetical protein